MKRFVVLFLLLGLLTQGFGDYPTAPNIADVYTNGATDIYTCDVAPVFVDSFGGSSVGAHWTQVPNGKTISETGGYLTLGCPGNADWWGGTVGNAPYVYNTTDYYSTWFSATVRLDAYTVNDATHVGMLLYADNQNLVFWGRYRWDAQGRNGLSAEEINNGNLYQNSVTTLPIWLRIRTSNGTTFYFDHSIDGSTWTNDWSTNPTGFMTANSIGLFIKSWGGQAIAAPFNSFSIGKIRWKTRNKT